MGAGDIGAVAAGNNIVALCDVDLRRAGGHVQEVPRGQAVPRLPQDVRRDGEADRRGAWWPRPTTPTPWRPWRPSSAASTSTARSRWPTRSTKSAQLMKAAQEHKVVTQLGNQGHSSESHPHVLRVDLGRGDRQRPHDPRRLRGGELGHRRAAAAQGAARGARRRWTGTCGWARRWSGRTTRPTCRASGAAGCRSATARSATGSATWSTRCSGPWTWARRRRSRPQVKDYDPKTQGDAFPKGEIITYEFPAKGKRGPITLHWYSGTERIPRPEDLEPDRKPVETGAVVLGDKGDDHVRLARGRRRADHPRGQDEGLQAAREDASRGPRSITRTGWRRSATAPRPAPTSPTAGR